MSPLSAVIITYNEARNIGRCLDSLQGIADEIVVVDSFSTDATEAICKRYGVRFISHVFEGHIEQKNWAMHQAQFDHILSLDADEALDDSLRQSILAIKEHGLHQPYAMNRLTNYCGQWIRHSGWYPDTKTRIFDRRMAKWGGTNPHDKIEINAGNPTKHLEGNLLHYSYYSVEEHYDRAKKYADIAAKAMLQQGKMPSPIQIMVSPLFKFIRNYVFKFGFLDGYYGWVICKISALETYWKYRKAIHLRSTTMIRLRLFALLLVCTACGSSKPPQQTYKPPARPQPAPVRPATPSVPATGMNERPTLPQTTQAYVNWVDSERLMPILEESKRLNKVVFVEFHASWCAPCKVMEEETMTQPSVYNMLNQYYLNFRTDYDTEAGRTIADIYEVTKLPTVLFLNDQGIVLERYTGIVTPAGFERLHALVQSKK